MVAQAMEEPQVLGQLALVMLGMEGVAPTTMEVEEERAKASRSLLTSVLETGCVRHLRVMRITTRFV